MVRMNIKYPNTLHWLLACSSKQDKSISVWDMEERCTISSLWYPVMIFEFMARELRHHVVLLGFTVFDFEESFEGCLIKLELIQCLWLEVLIGWLIEFELGDGPILFQILLFTRLIL